MYEYKMKSQKKERKFKLYIFLFIISVLVNVIVDLWIEKTFGFNIVANLIISATILYFGFRRKFWAESFIKFFVWINVMWMLLEILNGILN